MRVSTAITTESRSTGQAERRHHPRSPSIAIPTEPGALLELQDFGVAFGKKIVLCEISFTVPAQGATVLLGPAGTGKSTLLRALAGISSASPSFRNWGEVFYRGSLLDINSFAEGMERPELVAQSAHLMMSSVLENVIVNLPERDQLTKPAQHDLARRLLKHAGLGELCSELEAPVIRLTLAQQRHLAVLRQAAAGPRLLCIDEPTTGLAEQESMRLLTYLQQEATRRALLVVLHNQRHARLLGGEAVLMAGGYIQEQQVIPGIFDSPVSTAGRDFARNGTCTVPSPGTPTEYLNESAPAPKPLPRQALHYSGSTTGPRGFLWLKKERLAGTPAPGVYYEMEYDLKALQGVGVTTLVTLTEKPLDETRLAPFNMKSIWAPIPDMQAPSIEQGMQLCRDIEKLLAQTEVVAVHCRAGLGRTGTVLAAQLIWEGYGALDALETVRGIEPRWVQSQEQIDFLEAFASAVARNHAKSELDDAMMWQSQ